MQRASNGPVERSTTFSILRKGDTRPRKGSAPGRSSGSRLSGYVSSFPGDPSGFVDTPTAYSCGYSPGLGQNWTHRVPSYASTFRFWRPSPISKQDEVRRVNRIYLSAMKAFDPKALKFILCANAGARAKTRYLWRMLGRARVELPLQNPMSAAHTSWPSVQNVASRRLGSERAFSALCMSGGFLGLTENKQISWGHLSRWRWGGCRSPPDGIAMCHTRGVEAQVEGEGIHGRSYHHRR